MLWQGDVQKLWRLTQSSGPGIYWSNTYYLDAPNRAAAKAVVLAISDVERQWCTGNVLVDRSIVRIPGEDRNNDFFGNDRHTWGLRGGIETSDNLNQVVLVRWYGWGGSRKWTYWRGPLRAGDYEGERLTDDYRVALTAGFVAGILATGDIRTRQGERIAAAEVSPYVHLHQTRRGTRRRTQRLF